MIAESVFGQATPRNLVPQQNLQPVARFFGSWPPKDGHHGPVHLPGPAPRHPTQYPLQGHLRGGPVLLQ